MAPWGRLRNLPGEGKGRRPESKADTLKAICETSHDPVGPPGPATGIAAGCHFAPSWFQTSLRPHFSDCTKLAGGPEEVHSGTGRASQLHGAPAVCL
jgi:hypothetical protein